MNKKQEALIRAIKAAQEAGGFLQKQLAAMACTSPGNICSALSGAGSMSVEKWRLLCEGLALTTTRSSPRQRTPPLRKCSRKSRSAAKVQHRCAKRSHQNANPP